MEMKIQKNTLKKFVKIEMYGILHIYPRKNFPYTIKNVIQLNVFSLYKKEVLFLKKNVQIYYILFKKQFLYQMNKKNKINKKHIKNKSLIYNYYKN